MDDPYGARRLLTHYIFESVPALNLSMVYRAGVIL
jgi:hypothetical protein